MLKKAKALEGSGLGINRDEKSGQYRLRIEDGFKSLNEPMLGRISSLAERAAEAGEVALVIDIIELFRSRGLEGSKDLYRRTLSALDSKSDKARLKAAFGQHYDA